MNKTKLDTARLEGLAGARTAARAQARELAATYQEIREQLAGRRRTAALARANAADFTSAAQCAGERQAERLEAEAAELASRLAEIGSDLEIASAAAADAAWLLSSCIAFASDAGCALPRSLAAEDGPHDWMARAPSPEVPR